MNLETTVLDRFPDLHDFYSRLGNTPFIRVPSPVGGAQIYAKLERHNPTGTIKDRTAVALVTKALADAWAKSPHMNRDEIEILEYSGGSLAVSIAEICARLKVRCRLVLSESTGAKVRSDLQRYDTRIDWVSSDVGFLGVMMKAVEISRTSSALFLYQHENPANFLAHRDGTGREILAQLRDKKPAAWIASIGTGGTLTGVYARLREANPLLKMYAVSPAEMPYGTDQVPNSLPKFAGSGGLGYGLRQTLVTPYDDHIHQHFRYSFEESSAAAKKLQGFLGFEVGTSSGANWLAATEVAKELSPDQTVVTVFPS